MELEIFSTCPQSKDHPPEDYLRRVAEVARWSEAHGMKGILVYSDNGLVDPWLLSQVIVQSTESLCPLVAVQPVYLHPYAAAKLAATLGFLHGRRIYLNMIAGGFKNDLESLGDPTPHDERYERLVEYVAIVRALLGGTGPVTFLGRHYRVKDLRLKPPLPLGLFPGFLSSGSSEAGVAAAKAMGAVAVKYPAPAGQEAATGEGAGSGIRVGIVARSEDEEAWREARRRFPESGLGQVTHRLAMKVSDSQWHRQLSEVDDGAGGGADGVYWLGPFRNYQTFCPYLVGSYRRVGEELARYLSLGHRTFILDIPPSEEELGHVRAAFDGALEAAGR